MLIGESAPNLNAKTQIVVAISFSFGEVKAGLSLAILHNPATAASPAATSAGMRPPPTFSASSAATSVAPVVCPNSRMVETNPPADAARPRGLEPTIRRALGT